MPTTNMNLPIPSVGTTAGPDWATDNNNCFTLIDAHDHTTGNGVRITPSAININTALTFSNFPLTNAQYLGFYAQSAQPSGTKLFYVSGADVFYVDGNSNNIQITSGGNVNAGAGSITGMTATNAGVTYSDISKTFVFQSNTGTTTPAIIDASSYVIRNLSASSFGITISAPSLSANSNQTFPPLAPGSGTKIVTMDSTGLWGAAYDVDNATLQVSANTLSVKDVGITNGKIANNAVTTLKILDNNVTGAKIGTGDTNGIQTANIASGAVTWVKHAVRSTGTTATSGNIGLGTTLSGSSPTITTTSYSDVSGMGSVTFTGQGSPVIIGIISGGSPANITISGATTAYVGFNVNGSVIADYAWSPGVAAADIPASSYWAMYTPPAGSNTYKVQMKVSVGGGGCLMANTRLVVYEL